MPVRAYGIIIKSEHSQFWDATLELTYQFLDKNQIRHTSVFSSKALEHKTGPST